MTGRRAGFCSGFSATDFMNRGAGCGFGFGGGGRGRRNMYWATGTPGWARGFSQGFNPVWSDTDESVVKKDESEMLKKQAEYLEGSLNEINRRLKELEEKE